jgi:hypothetical protein
MVSGLILLHFQFNNENYSVEHPALSLDEKTLYFASDMLGHFRFFDLFSVAIDGENFGTPKKFGFEYKCTNETISFRIQRWEVIFLSDGHAGYGSLDVVDLKGDNFDLPSNVGLPVNATIFI